MYGDCVDVFLRCVAVGQGQEQVQIADGLPATAQRPRRSDRSNGVWELFDVRDDRRGGRFGSIQTESAGRALMSFHCFQDVLLAFFAKAGKVAELSLAR